MQKIKYWLSKNWLGLMKGNLETNFIKDNNSLTRKLNSDISIFNKFDEKINLGQIINAYRKCRTFNDKSNFSENDKEIPEGLMDAMFTT